MEFKILYNTEVDIIFDAVFHVEVHDELGKIIKMIEKLAEDYGFTHVDVIDKHTGELLLTGRIKK